MTTKVEAAASLPAARQNIAPKTTKPAEQDAKNIEIPLVGADDNPAPSLGIPAVDDSFGTFEEVEKKAAAISEGTETVEVESGEKAADGSEKTYEVTTYTTGSGDDQKIVAAKRFIKTDAGTIGKIAIGSTVYEAKDAKNGKITRISGDGYVIVDKNGNGRIDDGELTVSAKNLLLGKRYGTLPEVEKLLKACKGERINKYMWSLDKLSKTAKINSVQIAGAQTFATDINKDGIVNKGEAEGPSFIGTDPSKNPLEQLLDNP